MIKRNAWNDLQVAERVMNALKESFEEKEMAWARLCIKRGQLLFEEEPDWEVKKQYWDNNWQFACFAKGYDKKVEVIDSKDEINGNMNAWSEWKHIALREGWLTWDQQEKAGAQEQLAARERMVEEAGNWDLIS